MAASVDDNILKNKSAFRNAAGNSNTASFWLQWPIFRFFVRQPVYSALTLY